jgi:putative MATE family efflux protein
MNLTEEISYKRIWSIAWPVILGSIAQNIINVVDTAFLARVSETALGAAAIGGLFYLTLAMIGFGLSLGAQIIMSRRFGERNYSEIGQIFRHTVLLGFAFSALAIGVYFAFGQTFMSSLLHSPNVVDGTGEFLRYRMWGLFFAFINYIYTAFYVSIARTRYITRATIVTAVVTVVLDYLLIFGHFGFPKMGIAGAAIASVIAELSATAYYVYISVSPVNIARYKLWITDKLSLIEAWNVLKISGPLMLQNMISFTSWFIFFILIERMGERALAVSNVARSLYMILLLPTWGFAQAASSMVSYVIGRGEPQHVMPVVHKISRLTLLAILPMVLLAGLFHNAVLAFYTNDLSLMHDCVVVLPVIFSAALLLGPSLIFFSSVSGTGNTHITFRNEIVVISCYLLFTFIVVRVPSVTTPVVWIAEFVYAGVMGLMSYLYLRYGKWIDKKL